MAKGSVCLLVEPGYESSTWFTKSYAGLRSGAARRDLSVEQVTDMDAAAEHSGAVVLMGADEKWIRSSISAAEDRGLRSILLGASPTDFGGNVSGPVLNRRALVESLVAYFCNCGRTRLACLGGKTRNMNDELRRLAFLQAARQRGLSITEEDVYGGGVGQAISELLDHAEKYDGVICVNDQSAVLLMRMAAERGVRVPEQLFVAGSGGCIIGELTTPGLTTTETDYYEMGVQTANIWNYLEKDPKMAAVCVTIPCRIICRESTALLPVRTATGGMPDEEWTGDGPLDSSLEPLDRLENCLLRCDELDYGILKCILQGCNTEKIAETLYVAQGTVNYRLKKLFRALQANSRRELRQRLETYITDPEALEKRIRGCKESKNAVTGNAI